MLFVTLLFCLSYFTGSAQSYSGDGTFVTTRIDQKVVVQVTLEVTPTTLVVVFDGATIAYEKIAWSNLGSGMYAYYYDNEGYFVFDISTCKLSLYGTEDLVTADTYKQ